jgi:hypothetical protein
MRRRSRRKGGSLIEDLGGVGHGLHIAFAGPRVNPLFRTAPEKAVASTP